MKKNTEIAKRTYHSSKNVNQHNVREAAANQTENKANKKPNINGTHQNRTFVYGCVANMCNL